MFWKSKKKQEAIFSAVVDLDEELIIEEAPRPDQAPDRRPGPPASPSDVQPHGPQRIEVTGIDTVQPTPPEPAVFQPAAEPPTEHSAAPDATGTPSEVLPAAAPHAPPAVDQRIEAPEIGTVQPTPPDPAASQPAVEPPAEHSAAPDATGTPPEVLPAAAPQLPPAVDRKIDETKIAATQPAALDLAELRFVHVPAGAFVMGSPYQEAGRSDDEDQHEVVITRSFCIQVMPVTIRQWKAVMGNNPSCFPDASEDCPIEGVSWLECQQFIHQLNTRGDARYRLPTEAEWEYACRAGSVAAFANGRIEQLFCGHDPRLAEMGWYCGNSERKTHAVGQKKPNAWGLHDMHGNVLEWCQDWYGEYSSAPQRDPTGPPSGIGRVVRGGSWFSSAKNCRCASRHYRPPEAKSDVIGFRLVKEVVSG